MTDFLRFAIGWMLIGSIVGLTITLIETAIALKRKQPQDKAPMGFLLFAALWPINLGLAFVAYVLNRRSFFEQIARSMVFSEARDKTKMDRRAIALATAQGKLPYKRTWRETPQEGAQTYLFVSFFHNQENPVRVTHGIVRPPGGMFMAYRYMDGESEEHETLPLTAVDTFGEAKAACETDGEWLALCNPGLEPQRLTVFLEEIDKLAEPEEG